MYQLFIPGCVSQALVLGLELRGAALTRARLLQEVLESSDL